MTRNEQRMIFDRALRIKIGWIARMRNHLDYMTSKGLSVDEVKSAIRSSEWEIDGMIQLAEELEVIDEEESTCITCTLYGENNGLHYVPFPEVYNEK